MRLEQWTDTRPMVNEKDLIALSLILEEVPMLLPIMVGGEMCMSLLGDLNLVKILQLNEAVGDSLFIATDKSTVRMTRFQNMSGFPGQFVWDVLTEEQKVKMFTAEKERLGVELWSREFKDFYQGVCLLNFKQAKYVPLSGNVGLSTQDRNYLNSCLALNKAWLYDIPPWAFFCRFTFKGVKFKDLTDAQIKERNRISRNEYRYATVEELDFLHNL